MNNLEINYIKSILDYSICTGKFIRKTTNKHLNKINKDGYIEIQVKKKRYLAHRLAWFYVFNIWPTHNIDHADRNKTNNAIHNLRYLSPSQQNQNTNMHPLNTSGFRGVHWEASANKWRARIRVNNVRYNLGNFDTAKEAYAAYLAAVPKYHTHNPLSVQKFNI